MNFDQLNATLPNGFHDSRIISISIDYIRKVAVISLEIWVADQSDLPSSLLENYRPAEMHISGLQYFLIDVPDQSYPYDSTGPVTIDAGSGLVPNSDVGVPEARAGNFQFWIWVNEWNAFIRIAACDVTLNWLHSN